MLHNCITMHSAKKKAQIIVTPSSFEKQILDRKLALKLETKGKK